MIASRKCFTPIMGVCEAETGCYLVEMQSKVSQRAQSDLQKSTLPFYHHHLESFPTGKSRRLAVRMECNNSLASHHERSKRARIEGPSSPPHSKDPAPSSPTGGGPTTPVTAPQPFNPDRSSDVDQEMEERTITSVPNLNWDEDTALLPQTTNNGEPPSQAELLASLHKTLLSATDTLSKLSIHAIIPEHTLSMVQEIYRKCTKEKSPDNQGPSGDILSAIRKLAKDVEDLKRATPTPTPTSSQSPTRPKEVFATGPTFRPNPKTPKPTQPPPQLNNPWQRHHPACLVIQIPPTILDHDRLTGMKAVEAANAALAQHGTKASIIAVKWNDKGNCIVISHPSLTATDLEPFGNVIAAAITGKNNIACYHHPRQEVA